MSRLGAALVLTPIAVVGAGLGWALWVSGALDLGVRPVGVIAIIAGGVLATGALTGALMRLAFYSARKGYDDGTRLESRKDLADDGGGRSGESRP